MVAAWGAAVLPTVGGHGRRGQQWKGFASIMIMRGDYKLYMLVTAIA